MIKTARSPEINTMSKVKTRVVAAIPCYNTEKHIAEVVAKTKKYVDEVIIIDDGSTDLTSTVAKKAGARIITHEHNKGYGEAIKSCFTAMQTDSADVLVIIDGDGQHNPEQIPDLLAPIMKEHADIVIGSRFLFKGKAIPRYRKFGITVINLVWNCGSRIKLTDTQSGFRAYSRQALNKIRLSEKGMSISIEIIEKARRLKLKIQEVPITCSYENNNARLSFKAFRHGFSVALAVLRIRLSP
jgi:glycosyltransferase involved in cell wall biosynthesis